jgi:hypothetical protein
MVALINNYENPEKSAYYRHCYLLELKSPISKMRFGSHQMPDILNSVLRRLLIPPSLNLCPKISPKYDFCLFLIGKMDWQGLCSYNTYAVKVAVPPYTSIYSVRRFEGLSTSRVNDRRIAQNRIFRGPLISFPGL